MNNEVEIKVTINTSDVDSSIGKIKNAFKGLQSKGLFKGIDTSGISRAMDKVKNSVSGMKGKISKTFDFKDAIQGSNKFAKEHEKNAKKIQNANSKMGSSFGGLKKKILGWIGTYLSVRTVIDSVKQALSSMDSSSKFDTIFGSESQDMLDWVNDLNSKVTMAKSDIMDFSGNLYRMGKNMEMPIDKAKDMTKAMTELGADLVSVTGDAGSLDALAGALRGEYDSIQNYGYTLDNASVEARALAMGLDASSESAKALARQSLLLEQSGDILGYAEGHAKTLSGQLQMLQKNFNGLKTAIGNCFTGLLQAVLPTLNSIVVAVTNAFNKIATFINGILAIFGIEIKKTVDTVASNTGNISDSLGGASSGASDLAGGLGDANKEAKKLAKGLMGIDELNVLNKDDDSSSGGSGGGSGSSGGGSTGSDSITVDKKDDSPINEAGKMLDELREKFKYFLAGFNSTFDGGVFVTIKEHIMSIWESLKDIWNDEEVQGSMTHFLKNVEMTFGAFVGTVATLGTEIAEGIIGGVDEFFTEKKDYIKEKMVNIFNIGSEISAEIRRLLYGLSDIFSAFGSEEAKGIVANMIEGFTIKWAEITELCGKLGRDIIHFIATPIQENSGKIKEALEGMFGFIEDISDTLLENMQYMFDGIQKLYDEHIKPFIDSLTDGVSEIWGTILDGWNNHMKPVLDNLAKKFKEVFEEKVRPAFDKVMESYGKLVDAVKEFWEKVLQPFINWIAKEIYPIIAPIIEKIGEICLDLFGDMAEDSGNAASGITDIITELVKLCTEIGVACGEIWKDIEWAWGEITKTLDSWDKWFEDNVIEPMVDAWNNFVRSLPEGVRKFFGLTEIELEKGIDDAIELMKQAKPGDVIAGHVEDGIVTITDGLDEANDIVDEKTVETGRIIEDNGKEYPTLTQNALQGVRDMANKELGKMNTDTGKKLNETKDVVDEKKGPIRKALEEIAEKGVVGWFEKFNPIIHASGATLDEVTTDVRDYRKPFGEAMRSVVDEGNKQTQIGFTNVQTSVKNGLGNVGSQIGKNTTIRSNMNTLWTNTNTDTTNKWKTINSNVGTQLDNTKSTISGKSTQVRSAMDGVWKNVNNGVNPSWKTINSSVGTELSKVKGQMNYKWSLPNVGNTNLGQTFTNANNEMKKVKGLTNYKWNLPNVGNTKLPNTYANANAEMKKVKGLTSYKWNLPNVGNTSLSGAYSSVKKERDKVKGLLNFSWSLPKPSLPKFSVSGGKAPWGFGGMGSLPKVSIKWYSQGGIFNQRTLLGVGDGGNGTFNSAEAIIPISQLYDNIDKNFERQNQQLASLIASMSGGNQPIEVILNVDGKQMAKATVKNMKEMSSLGQLDVSWL